MGRVSAGRSLSFTSSLKFSCYKSTKCQERNTAASVFLTKQKNTTLHPSEFKYLSLTKIRLNSSLIASFRHVHLIQTAICWSRRLCSVSVGCPDVPTLRLINLAELSTVAHNYSLVMRNHGPDCSVTGPAANPAISYLAKGS